MIEYYKKFDKYADERHRNAIDLNFKYIDGDKYELPAYWGKEGIIVDLSTTGREQLQIVKSVCQQLISMYNSLEYGASLLLQQNINEPQNPAFLLGAVIGSAFSPYEFRIGNYITSKSWFGSHKISGIDVFRDRIDFKVNGCVHSQIDGKYFDLDRIPLTVEWLDNFGYKKRESSGYNQWWNGLNNVTHDWLVDITEMIVDGTFFYRNGKHIIKYVHELQNLHYMLSGEMLSLS